MSIERRDWLQEVDALHKEVAELEILRDNLRRERDALRKRVAELEAALREVAELSHGHYVSYRHLAGALQKAREVDGSPALRVPEEGHPDDRTQARLRTLRAMARYRGALAKHSNDALVEEDALRWAIRVVESQAALRVGGGRLLSGEEREELEGVVADYRGDHLTEEECRTCRVLAGLLARDAEAPTPPGGGERSPYEQGREDERDAISEAVADCYFSSTADLIGWLREGQDALKAATGATPPGEPDKGIPDDWYHGANPMVSAPITEQLRALEPAPPRERRGEDAALWARLETVNHYNDALGLPKGTALDTGIEAIEKLRQAPTEGLPEGARRWAHGVTTAGGSHVALEDGRLFIDGEPVSKDAVRAAAWILARKGASDV